MANRERAKGLAGEHEVAAIWTKHGWQVRGLEGTGDHLALRGGLVVHSEVKRQETARPWAWWEQALTEAPDGALPVVAFRRNRSRWLALADLEAIATHLGGAAVLTGGAASGTVEP